MAKGSGSASGGNDIVDDALRRRQERERGYREKALKLYPWVCGRCGRDFAGKNLRELTVHHRDHNHDYNPPDGSNWELLCLYCHDDEHSRSFHEASDDASARRPATGGASISNPFAGLKDLLKKKSE